VNQLVFSCLSVSGEMQHDLGSSNPGTGEGCLSPILMNWFVERSDDFSTGVEEGQQLSPVSVLDSPLHDEVSTTSEPSLAGHVMVLLLSPCNTFDSAYFGTSWDPSICHS
jgi:hypothetical protein